jgi:hypothetical protein
VQLQRTGGLAVAVFLALWGCSPPVARVVDGTAGSAPTGPFVAQAADFADFRAWDSFVLDGPAAVDGGQHTTGVRTVYLNRPPPSGQVAFPLGTVIVKTIVPNPAFPDALRTFAMAKRGGRFNHAGAVDWEWFELDVTASPPAILWRGVGPPIGDTYEGEASCNGCHALAASNDFVQSPPLALSRF